jgi:replicative DNA helicase
MSSASGSSRERANRPVTNPAPFDFEAAYHKLRLFDEEAEMAAIGAALLDPEIRLTLTATLDRQDFLMPRHQLIWAAIRELVDAAAVFDSLSVKDHLHRREQLETAGGYIHLLNCMELCPIPANGPAYAKLVRELSVKRRLVREAGSVLEDVRDPTAEAFDLLGRAQERLFAIGRETNSERGSIVDATTAIGEVYAQALELHEAATSGGARKTLGLSTGLVDLDRVIGGLAPGHLYVLAGRPSMGKSSLLFRIMESVGEARHPALLFSLEMARQQAMMSVLSSSARVPARLIYEGRIDDAAVKSLGLAAGRISDRLFHVNDAPDLTISELRAHARYAVHRHKIKVILVDYLQRIRSGGHESRQLEIADVSSQLKSMAKELGVPVLCAAQLNRSSEQRTDRRPEMSDLRESGQIEQDADVVMLLYREDYYFKTSDRPGVADLIIGKNRMGPTGAVELAWIRDYMRFENLARPTEQKEDMIR